MRGEWCVVSGEYTSEVELVSGEWCVSIYLSVCWLVGCLVGRGSILFDCRSLAARRCLLVVTRLPCFASLTWLCCASRCFIHFALLCWLLVGMSVWFVGVHASNFAE